LADRQAILRRLADLVPDDVADFDLRVHDGRATCVGYVSFPPRDPGYRTITLEIGAPSIAMQRRILSGDAASLESMSIG